MMIYEELKKAYISLVSKIPDGNEEFYSYKYITMLPDDLVQMIEFLKNNKNLTPSDVVKEEIRLECYRFFENDEYLYLSMIGLEEIKNHIEENRKFNIEIFDYQREKGNEIGVIRLFEELYDYNLFESSFSFEEVYEMNYLDYNVFVIWINSMYLTDDGYKYLEELKDHFDNNHEIKPICYRDY